MDGNTYWNMKIFWISAPDHRRQWLYYYLEAEVHDPDIGGVTLELFGGEWEPDKNSQQIDMSTFGGCG